MRSANGIKGELCGVEMSRYVHAHTRVGAERYSDKCQTAIIPLSTDNKEYLQNGFGWMSVDLESMIVK